MKRVLALILMLTLALSLVACGGGGGSSESESGSPSSSSEAGGDTEALPLEGKKIAYILNVSSSDIFQMAIAGAEATAEALGMTVDTYITDVDNVKFQDFVNTAANQGYDAMFLSHGNQETAYDLVTMLVDKGIEVVLFDTQLIDENGESTSIPGVTQMFQDDQMMADLLLDYICTDLYPEKVEAGEPIQVLKIWRGPGISPFDRRQETYLEYEEAGLIETVGGEAVGPPDPANAESSMATAIAALLPKYPEGTIDVIWGVYDAYTRGAYVALSEAGRTDIPVVSVDISNQDINYMLDGTDVWKACSTVDFTTVGEQGIRILAMNLMGEETEEVYNLTPSLVLADDLSPDSNVINLKDTIEGYGVNDDHISDWMEPYLK